jgi:hypothetical protein
VTTATRLSYLRVALILVGLIFIFGVYPLMMALWPSGWRWSPNQAQYEHRTRLKRSNCAGHDESGAQAVRHRLRANAQAIEAAKQEDEAIRQEQKPPNH